MHYLVADLDALGSGPSPEEIQRILASQGTAKIRTSGVWRTIKRSAPRPIDAWTHK